MKKSIWIIFLLFISNNNLFAQDPHRFDEEIKRFAELPVQKSLQLYVFTGSSSIRLWEDLQNDCNGKQVLNTGFGGSHMSDLLYFLDQTVLRFKPVKVYIYEGDNDLASGKEPESILETAKMISKKILESSSDTEIYFISAKPSPLRWKFKDPYSTFNALLKEYCDSHRQLFYIDIWNAMLDNHGRPAAAIFTSDSLHMNRQGYLLWKDIICKDSE